MINKQQLLLAVIAAITVLLVAAMLLGYDLSWVPGMLGRIIEWLVSARS